MPIEAWLTVGVIFASLGLLASTRLSTDVVLLGALTSLWGGGALLKYLNLTQTAIFNTPQQAVGGFANDAVLTVGVLFLVVAGLQETGAIDLLVQRLLGQPKTTTGALLRMAGPVGVTSAFLNNTTVVALFLPIVNDWCKKSRLAPSKLMIPLSYLAILGGVCSLIGTSTNLIVNGLLQNLAGKGGLLADYTNGMGMFEITWVGLPCAIGGSLFLMLTHRWLLPVRQSAVGQHSDPREYTVEMMVEPGSILVGKSIEEAGLRHLPSTYLMEIQRAGQVLQAVGPQERLQANDRLVFVGIASSMVDLQKIRGLKPATDQIFKLDSQRTQRILIEAVVSNTCPLVGMTIRDGHFRTRYNAVVIAVGRNGERIQEKIGNIVLQSGDSLLLEALPSFVDQQRNSRDFYLVSHLENSTPLRHERAWIAILIFLLMIVAVTAGWVSMLLGGAIATLLMLLTRCCTEDQAFREVNWRILLAIGASLGLGSALESTGAAKYMAESMVQALGTGPWISLAVIYLVTLIVTELITNNAAAVLMFPIAVATAIQVGVHPIPFIITVAVAASCGFATPLGYQTHMMVFGPGGYRFRDFLRIGAPMDLVVGAIAVTLIPVIWPFVPLA